MPHTDTCATNRTSYHASHRYQQITGNKSYILPCLTQIPAHHRQQIVHLTMLHTDTSKSQATNRTSCHASHRYQQITDNRSYILPCLTQTPANHRQQIVHLTMPHTDTSKSQPTKRTSYHASHGYQQIQATNLTSYHASHRCQQHTGNKSYILPCSHRNQQITGNKSYILPCLKQITNSKSQATSRTSYHASHRYQQITGNKSYILPCLTQVPATHRQQIVHLTMLPTDTRKSQAILPTNRSSCHAPC